MAKGNVQFVGTPTLRTSRTFGIRKIRIVALAFPPASATLLAVSDIYASWLPSQAYYAVHLFLWMGPVILIQWLVARAILWRHRWILIKVTLGLGSYLILTDVVAVAAGVWHFDKTLILGFNPLGVPIEEWAFFYLTVLLCTQAFLMFLPEHCRLPDAPQRH